MKRKLVLMFLMGLSCNCVSPFARTQENREYDNTVGLFLPQNLSIAPPVNVISVITTPDGYDNFDLGTTSAENHVSTNPLNPAWFFTAYNTNSAFRSTDGMTWTASSPSFGVAAQGDPLTAYDSLGNLYYETMYGGPVGCKILRSTDNGATWTVPLTSIAGVDKNWLACDQTAGPYANFVYTTMTASSGGNFARSTDFGATWTNTFTPTTQSLPGMMVAVGPNVLGGNNISGGCVYVVTHSGTNAAGVQTLYVSTDGGLSFTQKSSNQFSNVIGTEISGRSTVQGMRCRPYPFIAADNSFGPYRGRLYLVYASNSPAGSGNKSDIFLRYSTDQGATWTSAFTVNDDLNTQNNFQFHPAIWCDKETGRLYIHFYDTRNAPTSDSMDVYATYTDNGGATFAPNQRVTNRNFKINFNGGTPPTYRGDYNSVTSNRYTSLGAWTDFRNNNYLGMAAYFPDFAMLMSQPAVTMTTTDSVTVFVKIPSVKLYTGVAKFSATVSPAAPFTLSFVGGRDSLTAYPDSVALKIRTNNVSTGAYTVTVTGNGRNGTPIHKRTIGVTVQAGATTITVTSPNGGESWAIGGSQTITWTSSGVSGNVNIDLSTNGGTSFPTSLFSNVSNSGSQAWTVSGPASSTARVRIMSVADVSIRDSSNANFSMVQPSITVTSPNGGESLTIGSSQNITWTSANLTGNVKIELSTDGGSTFPTVIAASTANDNTEPWTVTGPVSSTTRIRISSLSFPTVIDTSNANFSMVQPSITVTSPNGGESWTIGSSQNITWNSANLTGSVKIELSTDGGSTFPTVIAPSTANDNTEPWTVTGSASTTCRVRISSVVDGSIRDSSNANFTINTSMVNSTMESGWNIVSLPVTVADRRTSAVFSTSTSNAFAYTPTGYVNDDTLDYGVGYWLKFASTQNVSLAGGLINSDTIDVVQGWNIIGSISMSVPVSSIIQIPNGIVVSSYYSYTGGVYSTGTTINPMQGYWVKVNQNGKLLLPGGGITRSAGNLILR